MLLLGIALALLFAKLLGYLFEKIKQPAVVGEILAGILLGSFVLGRLSGISFSPAGYSFSLAMPDFTSETFESIASIGIIILLFISGMETEVDKFKKVGKIGLSTASCGVVLPFLFGFLVGHYFGFSFQGCLAAGTIFVATSVGTTARVLMDMHALNTDVGMTILSAAVIDDVIALIILTIVLGVGSPEWLLLKIAVFFLVTLYFGFRIVARLMDIGSRLAEPKIFLTIAMVLCFVFAFFAEELGIAAITGAYIAGLAVGTTIHSKKIIDDVKAIGYTLFIPLFFVWIGASVDLSSLNTIGIFAVFFIPLAIAGKFIGCSIGARLGGLPGRRAIIVVVGMIPKMEYALIAVTLAISRGIFTGPLAQQMLGVTVLHVCITTLLAPILLKAT
ncbi:MAG: cation:proton antiporter, partial [Euryarchaeota archaeon]|nr:cation:proton antiporter [Euryarchaeota archaeon]